MCGKPLQKKREKTLLRRVKIIQTQITQTYIESAFSFELRACTKMVRAAIDLSAIIIG